MKKKVIIYGYSPLGHKIASILTKKDFDILIVDFDEKNIKKASYDGFETFNSQLLKDSELEDIGIKEKNIDSLFCISGNEKNNLFVVLSARNLNHSLKIISIAKDNIESEKVLLAGATKVLNPNKIGAARIFRHLTKPRVLEVLDTILLGHANLDIEEIHINRASPFLGLDLETFKSHKDFGLVLLGVMSKTKKSSFIFNIKTIKYKFEKSDVLVVIGDKDNIKKFNEKFS